MAYDAFVVSATVSELNRKVSNGTVLKVAQPERDELLITFKVNREPVRVCMSANASVPMVCIREDNALSIQDAPAFCMCLRKHVGGGRVLSVTQAPGYERIVIFTIEHLDEMGDRGIRYLICEIMGKHSNIILTKEDHTIIDSIKHVPASVSSLREILPGRKYFIPETSHHGYGKVMDEEIAFREGIDTRIPFSELTEVQKQKLSCAENELLTEVREERFVPNIVYDGNHPVEFSAFRLQSLMGEAYRRVEYDSMSEVIRTFYEKKNTDTRIRAKSEDIRQILRTLTERTAKKLDLQERQLEDTNKRDKYRIYGELINTYGYSLSGGEKELVCENYYDNGNLIKIPLSEHKTAAQNSRAYFEKYQKLKRTEEALSVQIEENRSILYHLESIRNSLYLCENEADLREIRTELSEAGYIKRQSGQKRVRKEERRSEPLHFVSSDGFDIFVGRNNGQNEELTFRISDKEDWWFHAKKVPGSHVIVRTGKRDLPDRTCLEAAALAAYYSKTGREENASLIEVDYVKRKELKKVPGAPLGFVIYHTNYSILVEPKPEL